MSKRNDRREAERQARKLAYQQLRQQNTQPSAAPAVAEPAPSQVSEAQLAANRANAQLSTGPATAAGRARSSKNALKHALTGKTVLLPCEDAAQYQRELDEWIEAYQPANDEEMRLVQSQNDCTWRIDRIQRLETSILYKGHLEFAEKYADKSDVERQHLINADAYLKYERQLRNLHIQEARIRRIREKDHAELLRLQAIRKREEAKNPPQPQNGFEFSTPANDAPAQNQPPAETTPSESDRPPSPPAMAAEVHV
jgi:hypothetical protein